jgi:hypothetical protein
MNYETANGNRSMDQHIRTEEQAPDSGPAVMLRKKRGLYLIRQTRAVLLACGDPVQLAKQRTGKAG